MNGFFNAFSVFVFLRKMFYLNRNKILIFIEDYYVMPLYFNFLYPQLKKGLARHDSMCQPFKYWQHKKRYHAALRHLSDDERTQLLHDMSCNILALSVKRCFSMAKNVIGFAFAKLHAEIAGTLIVSFIALKFLSIL